MTIRTDFMPLWKLQRRLHYAESCAGLRGRRELSHIRVQFSEEWPVFCALVAHELRHEIVYRSDDGRFARALVRLHPSLFGIFQKNMATTKSYRWQTLFLFVEEIRLELPNPKARHMILLSFKLDERSHKAFDNAPGIKSTKMDEILFDRFIRKGITISQSRTGKKWEDINELLGQARRLGRPDAYKLWAYNFDAVDVFFDSSEEERKHLLPGGELHRTYNWMWAHPEGRYSARGQNNPWRRFPIHELRGFAHEEDDMLARRLSTTYDDLARTGGLVARRLQEHNTGVGGFPMNNTQKLFVQAFTELSKGECCYNPEVRSDRIGLNGKHSVQHLFMH